MSELPTCAQTAASYLPGPRQWPLLAFHRPQHLALIIHCDFHFQNILLPLISCLEPRREYTAEGIKGEVESGPGTTSQLSSQAPITEHQGTQHFPLKACQSLLNG